MALENLAEYLSSNINELIRIAESLGISPKFVVRDVILAWSQNVLKDADIIAYGGYTANSVYIERGYARFSRDLDFKAPKDLYSTPDILLEELNDTILNAGDYIELEYKGYTVILGEIYPNTNKAEMKLTSNVKLVFLARAVPVPKFGIPFHMWLRKHPVYSQYPPDVIHGLTMTFRRRFGRHMVMHEFDVDVALVPKEELRSTTIRPAKTIYLETPFRLYAKTFTPDILYENYKNAFKNFYENEEYYNAIKTVVDLQVAIKAGVRDPEFASYLRHAYPILRPLSGKIYRWMFAPLRVSWETIFKRVVDFLSGDASTVYYRVNA